MTHSYTLKGQKRYRYYVCSQAQKQGWDTCPTKSLPAPEIERFVIDRIRNIGTDNSLINETFEQACSSNKEKMAQLGKKRQLLERDLRHYNRDLRDLISKGNHDDLLTTKRLVDLQEKITKIEKRITGVGDEIISISRVQVKKHELTTALSVFNPLWETLSTREQARIIHLLVDKVGYDGEKETVSLTFRPIGIKALAQEINNYS